MNIRFPYDVIGYWMKEHNIKLSSKAYQELAELFNTYSEKKELIEVRKEVEKIPTTRGGKISKANEELYRLYRQGKYDMQMDVLAIIDSKLK
jgi:hypothetical protein